MIFMQGIVKWFNNEKGYGFIEYKGKEIFVHYSAINTNEKGFKSLVKGELVEFDIVKTSTGLKAKNVICNKIDNI